MITVGGRVADAQRLAEVCQRHGIARLQIFGSVARGAAQPDSDLDVLYELLRPAVLAEAKSLYAA